MLVFKVIVESNVSQFYIVFWRNFPISFVIILE